MSFFFIFLLKLCEMRRKVQPQGQAGFEHHDSKQFWALVEESVLFLFPHMCIPLFCPLHFLEPTGLFYAAHNLVVWVTEAFQKKLKWST